MAHLCRIDKCLGSNAEAQFKYQDKNSICAVRDRFRVPGIPEKRTIVAPVRDRCGKFGPTGTERGREGVDGEGVFSIVFGNFSPFLHYTWGRQFAQSSQGKTSIFIFLTPIASWLGSLWFVELSLIRSTWIITNRPGRNVKIMGWGVSMVIKKLGTVIIIVIVNF